MFKILFCCLFLYLSVSAVSVSQQSVLQQVNSEYHVSKITGTLLKALAICQDFGMKLVTAPNAEVQAEVHKVLNGTTNDATWLAGLYLNYDGLFQPKWVWLNSEHQFSNYTNWGEGEPILYVRGLLNCVVMQSNGFWKVDRCDEDENYFICSTK
ncbi:unnamed protein product [Ceutorhynchus assimilis]|uniref:C-type lectin domain-containing protein n=1 Tax=Ceutorhynchus assimilis TaxID=467358 RepID=A0A9N9MMM1_9CUCU|nr:unnamed protein product [Ceutorhynchus assimilis]